MGWLDSLIGVSGGDGTRVPSKTYDNALEIGPKVGHEGSHTNQPNKQMGSGQPKAAAPAKSSSSGPTLAETAAAESASRIADYIRRIR